MKQDIVHYLMENPLVLTKLACGEASLIGVPDKLLPTIVEIFERDLSELKKSKGIFWEQ
ncbi:competence pheromone ComX [Bacillus amyloliquefaciens]|uniref:competence pheromone ComX n=1 Tax=Bacillus amyloliquefaciens TaxID=1390 RepID=UPI0005EFAE4B|nr:competence pheromone ComX [Bacillus amyloliquefaciens]MDH3087750.1 competence pheromone ComX [Bacillus amyloliquefaciens]OCB94962.1 Competence pheromone [Bacillus amyloliquefaciens]